MDPTLVVFAVEATLRLGRKLGEVLVDETHERAVVLPLGDLHADVALVDAIAFFERSENRLLTAEGGPYHGFSDDGTALEQLERAEARLLQAPVLPQHRL